MLINQNSTEPMKYVIKVRGQIVSIPFASRPLAESHIQKLPMSDQPIAEIVLIDCNGKELLLG